MIPATTFAGKNVAVFGLGATGFATIASLKAADATVVAYDDNKRAIEIAESCGIGLLDLRDADWHKIDALVLSPGVPLTHPKPHWAVELARKYDVEIIGDTEILVRELKRCSPEANLIAITGTNGKSTTTALIGHVLKQAGVKVQVGGNIGKPVLELDLPGPDEALVVEFSSYQIDLTPNLCPHVSILLNLSPDHIDRHGSMRRYAAIKARIFARQGRGDVAVIGIDDEWSRGFLTMVPDKVQRVAISSSKTLGADIFADQGWLYDMSSGVGVKVANLTTAPSLKGVHNWQNAAAGFAAARALGVAAADIEQGFQTFPGLEHRMECVGEKSGVIFVNDSKATNADAAARSLATFDEIYWIAGGQAKEGGIEELKPYFGKIRKAYLIGEAAEQFAQTLAGEVDVQVTGTLDKAVSQAAIDIAKRRDVSRGGEAVVLLAPACASFDQFGNFAIRGDAFRQAVAAIDGVNMKRMENTNVQPE